jgi:hypothetical protein
MLRSFFGAGNIYRPAKDGNVSRPPRGKLSGGKAKQIRCKYLVGILVLPYLLEILFHCKEGLSRRKSKANSM